MNSNLYKNKYKGKSLRLPHWDYRNNGVYFITICTKDKEHYFGEIKQHKMIYSPVGAIAYVLWSELANRLENVELGEFVIMPNHIHGILTLNNDVDVETGHALSLQENNLSLHSKDRFQNIGKKSISSIVGSYKSAVTKYANRLSLEFAWQSRFYEHIIRDEEGLNKITEYIVNNPLKWEEDRFYKV